MIPGMDPLAEQLETIAMIGITLAGAYPFVHVLSKLLAPVLNVIAKLMASMGPSRDRNAGLPGQTAPRCTI